jgi:DNA-binding transcriptional ArsR family regulator
MDAFQTLADHTRRQIVETLRGGEQQVNDIVDALDIHQSGVSRHLRLLLEAGFVQVRPDGQLRLYSLCPEPFRELEAWVASYQRVWDARLTRFGAALEKRRAVNATTTQRQRKKGAGIAGRATRERRPGSTASGQLPAQTENENDD